MPINRLLNPVFLVSSSFKLIKGSWKGPSLRREGGPFLQAVSMAEPVPSLITNANRLLDLFGKRNSHWLLSLSRSGGTGRSEGTGRFFRRKTGGFLHRRPVLRDRRLPSVSFLERKQKGVSGKGSLRERELVMVRREGAPSLRIKGVSRKKGRERIGPRHHT